MPKLDLSLYAGREQAYVKHYLLEKYLVPLAFKVGSAWDSIVYIDGFSGPWKVTDGNFADSSFAIAIDALNRARLGLQARHKNLQFQVILVEADKEAFQKLEAFASERNSPGCAVAALCGEFVDQIPAIDSIVRTKCRNPFRFVFLDPKGWAEIPMAKLRPFVSDRSCEVLINLMTRYIIRFLGEDDRADSYRKLFGRDGVLEDLREKAEHERADGVVREYCRSLTTLCGFKYVSSAVILDPAQESVRYFLVYATNDAHGIEVFKQAEMAAAHIQDGVRHETRVRKTGQPELTFDEGPPKSGLIIQLRERYRQRARKKAMQLLLESHDSAGTPYDDLFCEAMAFPLVTPPEFQGWIDELGAWLEVRFAGSTPRKIPAVGKGDRIVVTDRQALARLV